MTQQEQWESLTPEQKKKELFLKQKSTLDILLKHQAITKAQYDKSFGDLKTKMGFDSSECLNENSNIIH